MNDFFCETQNLAIGYGKAPLAEAIALGVRRGQILTLIGPNGAGKSTLLKTLAAQQHGAAEGGQMPGQRFEQRGFARAVRADAGQDLRAPDTQGDGRGQRCFAVAGG